MEAAEAKAAAFAMRTEVALGMYALIKRLMGGDMLVFIMKTPSPACLVGTP